MKGFRSVPLLFAALLTICGAQAASPLGPSPLNQPIEQLKSTLSAAAGCSWLEQDGTRANEKIVRCDYHPGKTIRFEDRYLYMQDPLFDLSIRPNHDRLPKTMEFMVLRRGVSKVNGSFEITENEDSSRQQATAIKAITALFPEWKDGRLWLEDNFRAAGEPFFENAARVSETTIFVRHHKFADTDGEYIYVVLTKKTDVSEFQQ